MRITAPAIATCIKELKLRLCCFPKLLAAQVNTYFAHCCLAGVHLWVPIDICNYLCPFKRGGHDNCR